MLEWFGTNQKLEYSVKQYKSNQSSLRKQSGGLEQTLFVDNPCIFFGVIFWVTLIHNHGFNKNKLLHEKRENFLGFLTYKFRYFRFEWKKSY